MVRRRGRGADRGAFRNQARKAREEGRVAKSQELIGAVGLLFPAMALVLLGPYFARTMREMLLFYLGLVGKTDISTEFGACRRGLLLVFRASYPSLGRRGRRRRDLLERAAGGPRIFGQAHYARFLQDRSAIRPVLQEDHSSRWRASSISRSPSQDRHHRLRGVTSPSRASSTGSKALRGPLLAHARRSYSPWRCG